MITIGDFVKVVGTDIVYKEFKGVKLEVVKKIVVNSQEILYTCKYKDKRGDERLKNFYDYEIEKI